MQHNSKFYPPPLPTRHTHARARVQYHQTLSKLTEHDVHLLYPSPQQLNPIFEQGGLQTPSRSSNQPLESA